MRIRGAKTELEEAGLDTEGMAESTSKLREEIKALSGVDIMQDENTFKSTYKIMDELAQKWGDLTDIQQASITELIAGKRQGNIVSSMMENFDEARRALEVSVNSEGSAMAEHEKWLDSVEAKQLQLKAAWEGLSQDFLSSDFLKSAINGLRGLVNVLDDLVNRFGSVGTIIGGFLAFKGAKGIASIGKSLIDYGVTKTATNIFGDTIGEIVGNALGASGKGAVTKVASKVAKKTAATTAKSVVGNVAGEVVGEAVGGGLVKTAGGLLVPKTAVATATTVAGGGAAAAGAAAGEIAATGAAAEGAAAGATALGAALPAVAVGLAAVAAGAIAAKVAYDKWYKKNYRWADDFSKQSEELKKTSDDYTRLIKYEEEYKKARATLLSPVATTTEVDAAKAKIEDIKQLLEDEYNLKISSDTQDLDNALQMLDARQRYKTMDEGNQAISDMRAAAEGYKSSQGKLDEYDKSMSDLQQKSAAVSDIRIEAQKLSDAWKHGAVSEEEYNKQFDKLKKQAFDSGITDVPTVEALDGRYSSIDDLKNWLDTEDSALTDEIASISDKYQDVVEQREKFKAGVESSNEVFAGLLANDVQSGNAENIDYDTQKLFEIGKTAKDAGLNTNDLARSFATAKSGYTDFADAISNGKAGEISQTFIDYKKKIGDFIGSEDEVVQQAALIRNGFSEVTPELQRNSDGIKNIIKDMQAIGQSEGIDYSAEQLTDMAHAMNLIPETKHIAFDVNTGEVSIIDDLANKVNAINNANAEIKFKINDDGSIGVLDTANEKLQSLISQGADIRVNFDVDTGNLELFNGTEKIGTVTAEGKIEWEDTAPPPASTGETITYPTEAEEAPEPEPAPTGDTITYPTEAAPAPEPEPGISPPPTEYDVTLVANGVDNGASTVKNTVDSAQNNSVSLTANGVDNGARSARATVEGAKSKTITLTTVVRTVKETVSNFVDTVKSNASKAANMVKGWVGRADGTAYEGGTAISGRAFKSGDWGTKDSGVALGGELGEELVVRNGKFFTIGSDSAELFSYQKGDIIFNAEQTKQIFSKGKITHGKRRAKAFNGGTAFADGSESKEDFDWIETFSDRVESNIDRFTDKFKSAYLTLANRIANMGLAMDETKAQIGYKQQAYDRYMQQANAVGLDESWAAKVRDGELDISTVTDDALKEKIKDYQNWYEKAIDCRDAIDELHESVADLYKENFDNISDEYENVLDSIEHKANMLNERLDRAEERGFVGSTRYYETLQAYETENLKQLESEQADLINALNEGLNSGEIEAYSDAWYELQGSIDEVAEAIEKSKTELVKFDNQMRQVLWDRFDYMQDSISNFREESDFLIDLIGDNNLYEDNGELNERGLSVLGLHGVNYDTYMAQAAAYAKEIKKIENDIANNKGDDNLIQRRQELLKLQRESILAANDEKAAMTDLIKEGIEEQTDSLKELIDAYIDSLDSAKDLYEYQQRIKEHTKDIASLEKQLSAYQNDTSEETKAKVQKLKVDLEEAQQDLRDTEYDKYVSDQKELLDSLYNEYESFMNERLDNLDISINELIGKVNDNASTINRTLTKETANVGTTLSTEMRSVWTSQSQALTSYFGNGGIILNNVSGYFENTNSSLSGINSTLTGIMNGVNDIVATASFQAKVDVDPEGAHRQMIQNSMDWFATDDANERHALEAENEKYGDSLGYTKNDGSWYDKNGSLAYTVTNDDNIRNIVSKMKANSAAWNGADASGRARLSAANEKYAQMIQALTDQPIYKDDDGVWWIGNRELYSYKSGGLANFTGTAWLDGTPSKPEMVLNAKDTENFIALKDTLRYMSGQSLSMGNVGYSGLSAPRLRGMTDTSSMLRMLRQSNNMSSGNTIGGIEINIPIEHVEDYNDFITQIQKDKQFEKFIRSVSVDLLSGGSTLAKNKYKWQ